MSAAVPDPESPEPSVGSPRKLLLAAPARSEVLSLDVSPPQQDGTVYVLARGSWDRRSATRGLALFRRVFARLPSLVVVDVTNVSFADAAGLDALLATVRHALGSGIGIDVQNLPHVGSGGSAQLLRTVLDAGAVDGAPGASEVGA